ncbi:MAG: hypothetical protein GWN39_08665, partial [Thermoplasmata archaeon]|nr:hypothetical protein [Thermoplasmata archaeon]NIS12127.1 hypothetical protein [Thermoplasmata archaeon]NIT77252.1 hypothetical protein [Thermoplasmata archaeon]NIV78811.1 hypothetical protein [Thermoplasmata archaeon]NIW88862.1 hypothetical protein [Thermoplasmata archaeon]
GLSQAAVAETEPGDRAVGIETEQIGGYTWTKDLRVTRNSAEDTLPQVV